MNRTLKRPMFRIGGSAGTGITSGLDKPRKQYAQGSEDRFMELVAELREQGFTQQEAIEEARRRLDMAKGGRVGYANGTEMPNFQPSGLPGFLTSFGLNLLATPPRGNIFQTAAVAAQDPFRTLQAQQAAAMKTASDRAFAKELAQEEREFEEGQLEKKLAAQERIANIKTTDTTERIQAIADTKYDGDTIKAAREVNFADEVYPNLVTEYGQQTVATSVIDTSGLQKQKDIDRFVKQNPQLARQVVYDVRTGKAVRFGLVNGKYTIQPADPKDIDDTNFAMPDPDKPTPGLFGQQTKEGRELKEILPDFRDPGFDEGFYQ